MSDTLQADHVLRDNEHLTVETPHGLIFITCSRFTGTGVVIYEDADNNPIASVSLRAHKDG